MKLQHVGLLGWVLLAACSRSNEPLENKNTNWLQACSSADDCGAGAVCVCGMCTAACGTTSACAREETEALCVAVSDPRLRTQCAAHEAGDTVAICAAECSRDRDCEAIGSGLVCSDGVCARAEVAAIDAGGPPPGGSDAAGGAGAGARSEPPADAGGKELPDANVPDATVEPTTPFPRAPSAPPKVERNMLEGTPKRILTRTRAWALPGPNASGIACDGDSIWVLSGGALLQKIDLPTGEVTREYDVALGISPGTAAHGIELIGDTIWISVAGNSNSIVVVDVNSGEIVRSWSSPTSLGPSDLALSEEGVWLGDGTGGLYLLDRANAAVLWESKLAFPERDYGIAVRGDVVVIGNLFGGAWLHRRSDLSVIAELVDEQGAPLDRPRIGTMCFAGDRLRILNERGVEEFAIAEE